MEWGQSFVHHDSIWQALVMTTNDADDGIIVGCDDDNDDSDQLTAHVRPVNLMEGYWFIIMGYAFWEINSRLTFSRSLQWIPDSEFYVLG